jgi:hypothetical protein
MILLRDPSFVKPTSREANFVGIMLKIASGKAAFLRRSIGNFLDYNHALVTRCLIHVILILRLLHMDDG